MWGDIMDDNREESIFSSLIEFTKKPVFSKIIVVVGVVGIGLIFLSGFIPKSPKSDETIKVQNSNSTSLTEYENQLEQNLAEIICNINGAGSTKVFLTMESSAEQIFASDNSIAQNNSNNTKSSNDTQSQKDITSENKYITVELSDGTQQTVLVKEIQPKVRGVLVVCAGGDNNVVKEKVIDAVTKALDISSSKVSVAGLSQ